jgi:hypothetical protein
MTADPVWQRVTRLCFVSWIAFVSSGRISAAVGRVMGQRPLPSRI